MANKNRTPHAPNPNKPQHGKMPHQKIKPYVVLQYLLRVTDEDHAESAKNIAAYLWEECGIYAERRSIYRDIEEINKVAVMMEDECTIDEAEETLAKDKTRELVVYDESKKGFYVNQRKFDLSDIRLLAECVYAAKFVPKGQADRLVDVVCGFVSEHQADSIKHNVYLTDRVKTTNKSVLNNIDTINEAMRHTWDGQPHTPEKISFRYLKYQISDVSQPIDRRHGERYIVSPYHLLISNGDYYLLAYSDKFKKMITYRIDRMRDVRLTNKPREGQEYFDNIDLKTYTQSHFSMFNGDERHVTIRAINTLLDTMVDRFGNAEHGALYAKANDDHFTVTAKVAVSDQFFGWLLGFGKRVTLISPDDVVDRFKAYLDGIREKY